MPQLEAMTINGREVRRNDIYRWSGSYRGSDVRIDLRIVGFDRDAVDDAPVLIYRVVESPVLLDDDPYRMRADKFFAITEFVGRRET